MRLFPLELCDVNFKMSHKISLQILQVEKLLHQSPNRVVKLQ